MSRVGQAGEHLASDLRGSVHVQGIGRILFVVCRITRPVEHIVRTDEDDTGIHAHGGKGDVPRSQGIDCEGLFSVVLAPLNVVERRGVYHPVRPLGDGAGKAHSIPHIDIGMGQGDRAAAEDPDEIGAELPGRTKDDNPAVYHSRRLFIQRML